MIFSPESSRLSTSERDWSLYKGSEEGTVLVALNTSLALLISKNSNVRKVEDAVKLMFVSEGPQQIRQCRLIILSFNTLRTFLLS